MLHAHRSSAVRGHDVRFERRSDPLRGERRWRARRPYPRLLGGPLHVGLGPRQALQRHQVIAMDCRGHGRSGKPHGASAYGIEMVNDVTRLLDHLHVKKAHVVGSCRSLRARARGSARVGLECLERDLRTVQAQPCPGAADGGRARPSRENEGTSGRHAEQYVQGHSRRRSPRVPLAPALIGPGTDGH
jgi:pimeloyl-ACP methyl ester carboxylesterase